MTDEYRDFLKQELDRRVLRNSSYSLRSFARDLAMPVSKLSELLNGRQRLSQAYAKKILPRLKWPTVQEKIFIASVELSLARTPSEKRQKTAALNALKFDSGVIHAGPRDLENTPYHFAVKSLIAIEPMTRTKNIVEKFGISKELATRILKDLKSSGQIEKDGQGWRPSTLNTRFHVTNESDQDRRRKMLAYRKAVYDLIMHELEFGETDPVRRLMSDIVFNIPSRHFPKLKEKLIQMKSDLLQYCDQHPEADDVYLFSLSFFPFSKKQNGETSKT